MRILLAHPRAWDPGDVAAALRPLRARYPQHEIVAGRDSFSQMSQSLGGWEEWARWCGSGTGADGRPSYNVILVPGETCGRATAQIVQGALAAGRAVFSVPDPTSIDARAGIFNALEVIGVHVSMKDWKQGSYVVVDRDCGLGRCVMPGCAHFAQDEIGRGLCPIHFQQEEARLSADDGWPDGDVYSHQDDDKKVPF